MNYNRRSTRPDSLFYRDQRKLRPMRGRIGQAINPISVAIIAAILAVVAFFLFR